MKNLIIILLLAVTTTQAQTEHQWFVKYSNDLPMAINGAYSGQENDIGTTYNAEYTIGIEFEHTRFSMAVETHQAIGYKKYSWLQVDYKRELFRNVYGYIGLEASVIYRHDGNRYETKSRFFNPGLNAEIQYNFYDEWYIGLNANYFGSESILSLEGKYIRHDVMVTLTFKI